MHHLLGGAPRRAPFTDWLAQVERVLVRRGHVAPVVTDCDALRACYDCGLQPGEIANTWEQFQ